jgi:hypothetical protein
MNKLFESKKKQLRVTGKTIFDNESIPYSALPRELKEQLKLLKRAQTDAVNANRFSEGTVNAKRLNVVNECKGVDTPSAHSLRLMADKFNSGEWLRKDVEIISRLLREAAEQGMYQLDVVSGSRGLLGDNVMVAKYFNELGIKCDCYHDRLVFDWSKG